MKEYAVVMKDGTIYHVEASDCIDAKWQAMQRYNIDLAEIDHVT